MKTHKMTLGMRKVDCLDVRKCGEITARISPGRKETYLNCAFCDYSYLQLNLFIQHVYEDHLFEFMGLNLKEEPKEIVPESPEQWEGNETSFKSESPVELSYNEQIDLRGFEKVEIDVDNSEISNDLDPEEEDASEEILSHRSPQYSEAKESDTISEQISENDNDSGMDWENLDTLKKTLADDFKQKVSDLQSNETYKYDSDSEISDGEEEIDIHVNEEGATKENGFSSESKFTLEFISVYKSLPALWNTKSANYRNRALKEKQYEKLLAKYREKYPNADKDSVKRKIDCLRTTFRRASKRRKPTQLYYYDAMTFLLSNYSQTELQDKMHDTEEIENKLEPTLEAIIVPHILLTDAQFIELAKIYEKYTCLWDENDIAYRFANRRREARNNLLEEFNKTSGIHLMMNDLEKEIARLRKICSNEKKQKLACKRKNLTYKPTCTYYDHIAYLEVDVSPYECEICGQIVTGPCQFKIHVSSHDGSLPFKCPVCGHGFKLTTNLTVHLRRHAQDYTYKCEVCDKPFPTTTDLKIHFRLHTGEKPNVCYSCGKTFTSVGELLSHMKRVHEKRKPYKCEICSKAFFCNQSLKDHINAHLKVRDNVCSVCDRGFTSRKLLRQHAAIHDLEKKYLCKLCGKGFSQSAGLKSHMKYHRT